MSDLVFVQFVIHVPCSCLSIYQLRESVTKQQWPSRSPLASGRTTRKNSVASLGEHFTSLLSLSHALQVVFLGIFWFIVVVWCYGLVVLWCCGLTVLLWWALGSTPPVTCTLGFAGLRIVIYCAFALLLDFSLVSPSHTLPVLFYCVVCYLGVLYCCGIMQLWCCCIVLW